MNDCEYGLNSGNKQWWIIIKNEYLQIFVVFISFNFSGIFCWAY